MSSSGLAKVAIVVLVLMLLVIAAATIYMYIQYSTLISATTPYIAFSVSAPISGQALPGVGIPLVPQWQDQSYNVGDGFSFNTMEFTAPYYGVYVFSVFIQFSGAPTTGTVIDVSFVTSQGLKYPVIVAGITVIVTYISAGIGEAAFKLDKGEQVTVNATLLATVETSVQTAGNGSFSGYLVSQL